jgi:hypothetical protein
MASKLVASFAELFFPGLPEEQARSQLALMVMALPGETEERGCLAQRVGGHELSR